MSKEMKDFLSQFMNQAETNMAVIDNKKPVEKKEAKPKTVKKAEIPPEKKSISTSKPKVVANTEGGVGESLSVEIFLQTVNDKKYTFDRKKNLQIDDQLFNVLNLLKQHENIKSIATLLNALIEKYIDDNKVELRKILSKNPLT